MSRRYRITLFIGALCTSYLAISGFNSSANAAPANNKNNNRAESEEDSDSWRGKSVFDRSRGEYTSEGVYLGSFKFKPSIDINENYNSNIYAQQNSTKSDTITTAKPLLALESDWSRNALQLNASGNFAEFSNHTHENYGDYSAGASGRLDILRETYLLGAASTSHLHEDRGSPDSNASSKSPTEYNLNNANVSFMRNLRRVSLKIDGNIDEYSYQNGETTAGTVIRNNDRNRNEYKTTAKLGYEIIPEYEAFIRGSLNTRNYDAALDQNGLDRDSNGYDAVVGTALNLGGKTKGEVFAGYMSQGYKAATLKDIGAAQFGADLLWNATGLTSVKAAIVRGVQETVSATSSGYIATTYSLALEHELQYNVLAGVNVSYSVDDYQSRTAAARNDDIVGAGAELRYLINRNASLVGRYDYTDRDSNVVGQDYDSSLVSLGLKLAM